MRLSPFRTAQVLFLALSIPACQSGQPIRYVPVRPEPSRDSYEVDSRIAQLRAELIAARDSLSLFRVEAGRTARIEEENRKLRNELTELQSRVAQLQSDSTVGRRRECLSRYDIALRECDMLFRQEPADRRIPGTGRCVVQKGWSTGARACT